MSLFTNLIASLGMLAAGAGDKATVIIYADEPKMPASMIK